MTDAQTALGTGVVQTDPERFEVELPSGAKAQVLRKGKGKHLVRAEQMVPRGTVPGTMRWNLALIAVKALVNGQPLTVEEVEEMNDLDVLALVGACLGKGGASSATST